MGAQMSLNYVLKIIYSFKTVFYFFKLTLIVFSQNTYSAEVASATPFLGCNGREVRNVEVNSTDKIVLCRFSINLVDYSGSVPLLIFSSNSTEVNEIHKRNDSEYIIRNNAIVYIFNIDKKEIERHHSHRCVTDSHRRLGRDIYYFCNKYSGTKSVVSKMNLDNLEVTDVLSIEAPIARETFTKVSRINKCTDVLIGEDSVGRDNLLIKFNYCQLTYLVTDKIFSTSRETYGVLNRDKTMLYVYGIRYHGAKSSVYKLDLSSMDTIKIPVPSNGFFIQNADGEVELYVGLGNREKIKYKLDTDSDTWHVSGTWQ